MSDRLSVLEISKRAMLGIGLPAPTSLLITKDNDYAAQIVQCLYDVARDAMNRHEWRSLVRVGNFNTVATESQGDIYTIFSDFRRFIDETMWNVTLQRPIEGPISDTIWREAQTMGRVSADYKMFRLLSDELYLYGQTAASEAVVVEYLSTSWIKSGLNRTSVIDSNTAVPMFPADMLIDGVRAMWQQRNGQDSSRSTADYERSIRHRMAADGGIKTLSMNSPQSKARRPRSARGDVTITGY